jgi:hypothetical protein
MKIVSLPHSKLEIVWRNPKPVRCSRRWETIKQGSGFVLYIVQEFLSTGTEGFWYTTSGLEVVSCQQGSAIAESLAFVCGLS